MKLTTRKTADPWAATLSTLTKYERAITAGESNAMEARWLFGRELLNRRVTYKGRQVVPADLMKLAIEKCGRSRFEIVYRIKFAERFPTKKLMVDAVYNYPAWRQMIAVGLVEKHQRQQTKRKAHTSSGPWLIRRLSVEIERAWSEYATLTRDQVASLEQLHKTIGKLLQQIGENDDAKAEQAAATA